MISFFERELPRLLVKVIHSHPAVWCVDVIKKETNLATDQDHKLQRQKSNYVNN